MDETLIYWQDPKREPRLLQACSKLPSSSRRQWICWFSFARAIQTWNWACFFFAKAFGKQNFESGLGGSFKHGMEPYGVVLRLRHFRVCKHHSVTSTLLVPQTACYFVEPRCQPCHLILVQTFSRLRVLQICNDALFAVMTQQGVQISIRNASNVELQFRHGVFFGWVKVKQVDCEPQHLANIAWGCLFLSSKSLEVSLDFQIHFRFTACLKLRCWNKLWIAILAELDGQ